LDWSTLWPKVASIVVAVLVIPILGALFVYLRKKIALVDDEDLRNFLLQVVAAVERLVPRNAADPEAENATKLELAKTMVLQEKGKAVTDAQVAAAVTMLKGAVK